MSSPRLAILRFCLGCIVDPGELATPAEQVAACPSPDCPLYDFRPSAAELAADGRLAKRANATDEGQKRTPRVRSSRRPRVAEGAA